MRDNPKDLDGVQNEPRQDPAGRDRTGVEHSDYPDGGTDEKEGDMKLTDPTVRAILFVMRRKGWSVERTAEMIHVNRSTLYKRLDCPETIKLDELRLLAKVFEVDIGALARGKQ